MKQYYMSKVQNSVKYDLEDHLVQPKLELSKSL